MQVDVFHPLLRLSLTHVRYLQRGSDNITFIYIYIYIWQSCFNKVLLCWEHIGVNITCRRWVCASNTPSGTFIPLPGSIHYKTLHVTELHVSQVLFVLISMIISLELQEKNNNNNNMNIFVDYSLLHVSCLRKASFLENSFNLIMAGFAGSFHILELDIFIRLLEVNDHVCSWAHRLYAASKYHWSMIKNEHPVTLCIDFSPPCCLASSPPICVYACQSHTLVTHTHRGSTACHMVWAADISLHVIC